MFSVTKIIRKQLSSYRLITSYFLIFVTSTLCLFALSTVMLDFYLTNIERERVTERAEILKSIYERHGFEGLLKKIRSQHQANKFSNIYIHITDKNGKTIWLTVPQELTELDSKYFSIPTLSSNNRWHAIDLPIENDLDILVNPLPDGHILYTGRTTARQEFMVEGLQSVFLIILAGIIILGLIGGIMFSRHVLRPVRELASTVEKVASGNMESRVPIFEKSGELQELAELFNLMLTRIETLITAMRDTLGNVSHELKTPLARMKARIEQAILSDASAQEQREVLMDCAEDVDRIDKLINMLMNITEAETGQMRLSPEPLSCSELIKEVLDLYEIVAEEKNISIYNLAQSYTISADKQRAVQVIANLTDNALKYTQEGGKVTFQTILEDNFVVISIKDNGSGIPQKEHKRIFEKLYRLDKSRSTKGLGLGLSLVHAVMKAHHGSASIHNAPDGGAIFELRFPKT